MSDMAVQYERLQAATFTAWINSRLAGLDIQLESLSKLGDGITLIKLIEVLSDSKVNDGKYSKKPRMRVQIVDNLSLALAHTASFGVNVTARPANFIDGDIKMILGFVWSLICSFQINSVHLELVDDDDDYEFDESVDAGDVSRLEGDGSGQLGSGDAGAAAGGASPRIDSPAGRSRTPDRLGTPSPRPRRNSAAKVSSASVASDLLEWVKATVKDYALSVTNLTSSFSDGKVFCALCEVLEPSALTFADVPAEPAARLELAFAVAESSFDIPRLLVAEAVTAMPDKYSIMTYLSYFRTYQVSSSKASAKAEASTRALQEAQSKLKNTADSVASLKVSVTEQAAELSTVQAELAAANDTISKLSTKSSHLDELLKAQTSAREAAEAAEAAAAAQAADLARQLESAAQAPPPHPPSPPPTCTVATQTGPFDELDLLHAALAAQAAEFEAKLAAQAAAHVAELEAARREQLDREKEATARDAAHASELAAAKAEAEAQAKAQAEAHASELAAVASAVEHASSHEAELAATAANSAAHEAQLEAQLAAVTAEAEARAAELTAAAETAAAREAELTASAAARQAELEAKLAAAADEAKAREAELGETKASLAEHVEALTLVRTKFENERTKRKALKELSIALTSERDDLNAELAKLMSSLEASGESMDELRGAAVHKLESAKKKAAAYKEALVAEREKSEAITAKALKLKSTNSALKDELRQCMAFKDALIASKAKGKVYKAKVAELKGQLEDAVGRLLKEKTKRKAAEASLVTAQSSPSSAPANAGPSHAPSMSPADVHNIHALETSLIGAISSELDKQREQVRRRMQAAKARKAEARTRATAGGSPDHELAPEDTPDAPAASSPSEPAPAARQAQAQAKPKPKPKMPMSVSSVEDPVCGAVGTELEKQRQMMAARIAALKARKAKIKAGEIPRTPRTPPREAAGGAGGSGLNTSSETETPRAGAKDKAMISALQKKLVSVKKKNKALASKLTSVKKARKTEKVKDGMGDTFSMEASLVAAVGSEMDKQRERTLAMLKAAKARKAANRSRSTVAGSESAAATGREKQSGTSGAASRSTKSSNGSVGSGERSAFDHLNVQKTEDSVRGAVGAELDKQRLMMKAIMAKKKAAKVAKREAAAVARRRGSVADLRASASAADFGASDSLSIPSSVMLTPVSSRPSTPCGGRRGSLSVADLASSPGGNEEASRLKKELKLSRKKLKAVSVKLSDVKGKNKKLVERLETLKKRDKSSKLKAGMGESVFSAETTLTTAVSSELDKQRKRMALALAAARKRKAARKAGGAGSAGASSEIKSQGSRANDAAPRTATAAAPASSRPAASEANATVLASAVATELDKQRQFVSAQLARAKARRAAKRAKA
ncbi:cortexillin-1 [Thecamonas trahens ATCC 50062]|uniref:Cortexillin-1 n=1 Tax=Thecamonas trahens ATCC 50062 TaxID=461836 RepID=A0A0L0D7W9_THETB|nr:cortexillin-1 [Thecamonas trahens ATCC 50062]KNC48300.1 cortexillin-1 [Thecamonas trahens ATCC 50062]|eukprot:XP_013758867.1 cortexillin-1 [Thecamonas trahens ATCC 50062]